MIEHMTVDEYKALVSKNKPTKYKNVPTTVGGVQFASKKEAERWGELTMMQRAGAISDLERQVKFDLVVNGILIGRYTADAVYTENGKQVVEDVKAKAREPKRKRGGKRKQPPRSRDYILRRKLMLAVHGIEVREV